MVIQELPQSDGVYRQGNVKAHLLCNLTSKSLYAKEEKAVRTRCQCWIRILASASMSSREDASTLENGRPREVIPRLAHAFFMRHGPMDQPRTTSKARIGEALELKDVYRLHSPLLCMWPSMAPQRLSTVSLSLHLLPSLVCGSTEVPCAFSSQLSRKNDLTREPQPLTSFGGFWCLSPT